MIIFIASTFDPFHVDSIAGCIDRRVYVKAKTVREAVNDLRELHEMLFSIEPESVFRKSITVLEFRRDARDYEDDTISELLTEWRDEKCH